MRIEWVVWCEEVCERLRMRFGTVAKDAVDGSFTPCFL
jgi:hypothetical protein